MVCRNALLLLLVGFMTAPLVAAEGPALLCTPEVYGVLKSTCGASTGGDVDWCSSFSRTSSDGGILRGSYCVVNDPELEDCDTAEGSQSWAADLQLAGGVGDDYAEGGLDCGDTENVLYCAVDAGAPQCLSPPLCENQEGMTADCTIPGGDAVCWMLVVDYEPAGATGSINCFDPWVPVSP